MLKKLIPALAIVILCSSKAFAACPTYSYTLTNGTTADATQVMANFNDVVTCMAPLASPHFTGSVGIGTTSPIGFLNLSGTDSGTNPALVIDSYGFQPIVRQRRIDGTAGSPTHVLSGENIGNMQFAGYGTTTFPSAPPVVIRALAAENFTDTASGASLDILTTPVGTDTNAVVLHLDASGAVGIGTTSPAVKLAVVGDIRTGTSGTNGCIQNFAGTALSGTCSSDAALKSVTGTVSGVLDKLANLQLVHFYWNKTAATVYRNATTVLNTGFIAQSVERQFPELVSLDVHGYRQLDYTTLSLYGLEAIKELKMTSDRQIRAAQDQQTQIQALVAANREQAAAIHVLQSQVAALQRKGHIRTAAN